ncbi:MAG: hypothetical protein LKM45_06040, partial [Wolbachia endosymbiont of Alcedoecus sp.]|nr:hypothetical protein [Wolbachia endosymbiont of Alcedoecus sp.]
VTLPLLSSSLYFLSTEPSMSSIIEKFRTRNLFIPPNAIEIENSNVSIKEVAEEITNQMYRLSQIDRVYAKG